MTPDFLKEILKSIFFRGPKTKQEWLLGIYLIKVKCHQQNSCGVNVALPNPNPVSELQLIRFPQQTFLHL